MKKYIFSLFSLLLSLKVAAQDITGQWNGALKVQGTQLRLVFHISRTANGLSATMDSPDQGAKGIPMSTAAFENSVLSITLSTAKIEYQGTLGKDSIIVGTFRQNGQSFPLNLSRAEIAKQTLKRPQEPTKPYPYYSEDVQFENSAAGITLAGTLTLPQKDGVFPVVVLITGSGPQNRNEELLGHKPFLVIADYLTRNGIGVLRYDDRGTALSKGNFKTATSADFATDVQSAIAYLKTRKDINTKQIGLIGHSEGGLIAPMVASQNKDVAFIVLLAGPGIPGDQILLLQQKLIGRAGGVSEADLAKSEEVNTKVYEMVRKSSSLEQLSTDLTSFLMALIKENPESAKPAGMTDSDFVKLQVSQIASPWMQYFIKYDPVPALEKVRCPVLALNGAKDLQVPPKENLEAIRKALAKGGNKQVTLKEFPNLNHLFQECTTGAPSEYATIEMTFSPAVLSEMVAWIHERIK